MTNNTLEALLQTNPEERDCQNFFESNVGAICGSGYFMGNAVIRKFPLGTDYVTDFSYVNPQSGRCFVYLVELESPSKSIFTKNDQFTQDFNQALQQVNDWLIWCSKNRESLNQQLEPLRRKSGDAITMYAPRGILIYGRSAEINSIQRQDRWTAKTEENHHIQIRTYDGWARERKDFLTGSNFPGYLECVAYQNRNYNKIR